MSKKSEKIRREHFEREKEWKWRKKTFFITTTVTIICSVLSAIIGFIGGKSTINNYYGDIITYQAYGEVIEDVEKSEDDKKEAYNINVGKYIALYATKYCMDTSYVWGGTSLSQGVDASGFVLSIYKKYGIDLPHSSSAIAKLGEEVNFAEVRDGDIVCYEEHVGIYVGEGMVVHASNPRRGTIMSDMYYREPVTIRRFNFAETQEKNNE